MADNFHRTRSSPDGKPVIACMRNALADAGVTPGRCRLHQRARHLDARRTTRWNMLGVSTVFGERVKHIPISSNKSMIGHTLTAAGAIEAVVSAADHQQSAHPADDQLHSARIPPIPLDVVPNVARDAQA